MKKYSPANLARKGRWMKRLLATTLMVVTGCIALSLQTAVGQDLEDSARFAAISESQSEVTLLEIALPHRLQLVDEALDQAQALVPESRVRGVEAEGSQKLLVVLGAARRQHFEILVLKARLALLVDRV